MLTEITIQGFKSIHHLQDLELGQVNVFIGANGSGKSNLLEAVGMLSAVATGWIDSESLSRRGVRLSIPELYTTSLRGKEVAAQIEFGVAGEWNDSRLANRVVLVRPTLKASGGKWVYKEEFPDSKLRSYLSSYAIFSPTTPVLRGIQPDMAPRDPLGLLGGRLAEAVEDILDLENEMIGALDLDDVLDLLDWVDGFDITSPSRELLSPDVPSLRSVVRFKDYWMNEARNQLSGYDANEGALYVLFMLVLALHPRTPPFFAIDNFDQSLNPRLARALTRLFCQLMIDSSPPRQVLLTTHNPLVLDGLELQDDRIRLFAVERTRSTGGATQVYRVQVSEQAFDTQEGLSLSKLWVMGRFGGVPNLF